MAGAHFYRIGTSGQPWGDKEKAAWLEDVSKVQRSYQDDILARVENLKAKFDVQQYGALSIKPERYPLFCVKSRDWDASKPYVMVTGGVHGYEASGALGALLFLETEAEHYSSQFNILVCPCISPWGYECVQRWSTNTVDPNRSFEEEPKEECEEAGAVVKLVAGLGVKWLMHIDLHETTDTDFIEFRPAKASRDGKELDQDIIPDGFFFITDASNPQPEWHHAIVDAVKEVVPLTSPDEKGEICGFPATRDGTCTASREVFRGTCFTMTSASFVGTAEVYPDSKTKPVSADECNLAHVTAVKAGLDWIIANVLESAAAPAQQTAGEAQPGTA